MRITFLTQWFDPEPAALRGLPLATWLVRRGHEVEVVTGFPNYPGGSLYPGYRMRVWQREMIDGVTVTRLPLYPSHDASASRRAANFGSFALSAATIGLVLPRPSDVVYVYHPPPTVGLAAMLWKTMRSTPFVYHIADMWPDSVTESGMVRSATARRAIDRALEQWCSWIYRGADAITVLSPGFKRLLMERGVPEEKVDVIYNWADESIFWPARRDDGLADQLGLTGSFNILYAGNLGHLQGLDTAIRALGRVAHLPMIQLVFAGTGQAETDLKSLARDLGLENVRFLPRRDQREMNSLCSLADAMLVSLHDLPLFETTIPSKTQVALATGRPLVMAVRGDAARLVEAASAGIVCAPGDAEDMASAFERLYVMSTEDREAMGARGRAYYQRHLSLSQGAGRTEEVLRRVVEERSTPTAAPSVASRS